MNETLHPTTSRATDVLAEIRDSALWLTINRESVRNALNDSVLDTLADHIRGVSRHPEVRAIVLTGSGTRAFSAGGDLKSDSATFEFDYSRPSTSLADLMRAAFATTLPMIARVNGHCLAGGMGLLGMCDLAVATEDARFGLPEVKVGMFPMQVVATLRRLLSERVIAELCFTGEPISARQALQVGLLNDVVPTSELDTRVAALLASVVKNSPTAIRRGKYALRATLDMTIEQALAYMETQLGTLSLTQDAREGLASFNQKRPPTWPGR